MQEQDDDSARGVPPPGKPDPRATLAALAEAVTPRPGVPPPPARFDDRRIGALKETWRLLPEEPESDIDLGAGWRRRLRNVAWRLLRPILERQQRFNTLLVQHLDGNADGMIKGREATVALVTLLDRHLGDFGAFQSRLLQHLDHAADALQRTREELKQTRRELKRTRGELKQTREELKQTQEKLTHTQQSASLATASTHGLKREVERLRRPPAPAADADAASPAGRPPPVPEETDLDAHQYVCFEDAFRGPPEEIAARQRAYLRYFEGASEVVDVGCGRGEFLALLRDAGIAARGVDANAEAVERCRERGLEAARSDALGYLRRLPDESIGGLFSAQVVEHLEADYLMQLLGAAHRTLRPGSRVVLETINPASWTAFFSAYVRDITHRHPLHPETLGYLLRACGFVDVTTVYRAPIPDAAKLQRAVVDPTLAATPAGDAVCALAETINQHADRLNGLVFAEQDYAAIARRP